MDKRNGSNRGQDVSRRKLERASEPADWSSVNPALLHGAIAAITGQGGAIRFGYTRDGGAYSIGILGDGEPRTDYVRPNEDIEDYLRQLIAVWEE